MAIADALCDIAVLTFVDDIDAPGGGAVVGHGDLRGQPGRAARRMARFSPVHHMVDDHPCRALAGELGRRVIVRMSWG